MSEFHLSPEKVAKLAVVAIDATTKPNGWDDLCDLLAEFVDAAAFFVVAYDHNNGQMPHIRGSAKFRSVAMRPLIQGVQAGEGREDDFLYAELARHRPGRVLGEHELSRMQTDEPLPPNVWRERMLSITGGRARCLMRLNDVGPFLDCTAVHGRDDDGAEGLGRIAPIVAPILARTLETTRIVNALAGDFYRLFSLFDQLDFGAAFCTPAGGLITANRAFKDLLKERDGLWDTAFGLRANDAPRTALLRRMISDAAQPETAPDRLTLPLMRRKERLPLVLCVSPVRSDHLGASEAVLLLALDPEDPMRVNANGLALLGALTSAEIEVCNLLVRGFETAEIALHRGTSQETARGQIKAAAAKLACRSRLDILRLALVTAAPVRHLSAER